MCLFLRKCAFFGGTKLSFAHRRVVIYVPGFGLKRSGGGNIAFFGNVFLAKVAKNMYLAIL